MSHVRDIEQLLRDTMGLDAETLGANAVERAVRARLAAIPAHDEGIAAYSMYWQRLQQSPQELQALIEAVVVPETWFFRHREAFVALAQMARDEQAARRGTVREGQPLRLLSLPCATGEEPYSMAMALFDAGFDASSFTIDALDISERALAIAREGVYGRNSFRGPPATLLFRDRHFTPLGESYRVIDALRSPVRWHAGNLFDASLVERLGTFDFVFFRNVLIYFDRETQQRAIALLMRLMRMGATLFAGPAEGGTLTSNGLTSTGHAQAFSFRVAGPISDTAPTAANVSRVPGTLDPVSAVRPADGPRAVGAVLQRRTHITQVAPLPHALTTSARPLAPASTSVCAARSESASSGIAPNARADNVAANGALLEQARVAADGGDFTRAVALCRYVLATDRANAQAEYLLGLVDDARGDAQGAMIHYRRALYLEPNHYEALVHCAAQLDARGDAAGARRLLDRAERVRPVHDADVQPHDRAYRHGARHR
jgi:chemotaxis protein methyltransferase WspC